MGTDIFQMKGKRNSSLIDLENRKSSQNRKWASVPAKAEQKGRYFLTYQTAGRFLSCLPLNKNTSPNEKGYQENATGLGYYVDYGLIGIQCQQRARKKSDFHCPNIRIPLFKYFQTVSWHWPNFEFWLELRKKVR